MLGIDLLALAVSSNFMLTQGVGQCKAQGTPKVTVTAATKDVRYDFSKNKSQLAQQQIDTVSPYNHDQNTYIGGLMNGQIEVKSNVKLAWYSNPVTKTNCYWYDEVKLHMEIDPTILIAREFPQGTCEHREVLHHENKHIAVDRLIVKKYRKAMDSYLNKVVESIPSFGPSPTNQTPNVRKKMSAYIEAAIKKVTDQMYAERRARQQGIDTKEEYDRVSAACQ